MTVWTLAVAILIAIALFYVGGWILFALVWFIADNWRSLLRLALGILLLLLALWLLARGGRP